MKSEQEKAAASSQVEKSAETTVETPPENTVETPADSSDSTQSDTQSEEYALNEYGNTSVEVLRTGVKVNVNPADPEIQKKLGSKGTLDPNVTIPNPWAPMQSVSPYIGQASPPASWAKPTPNGAGEYRWSPEAGCWRYYSNAGKAMQKYLSMASRLGCIAIWKRVTQAVHLSTRVQWLIIWELMGFSFA